MAQKLFEGFVRDFKKFYEEGGLIYNVHSLLHVVGDVKLHGPVDNNYSAYKFGNCIQLLGNKIRSPTNVLQQLYNRFCKRFLLI